MYFKNQNNCIPGLQAGRRCAPVKVRGPGTRAPERGAGRDTRSSFPASPVQGAPARWPSSGRVGRGGRLSCEQGHSRLPLGRGTWAKTRGHPTGRPDARRGARARAGGYAFPEQGAPTEVGRVRGAAAGRGLQVPPAKSPDFWETAGRCGTHAPATCPGRVPVSWNFRGPAALGGAPPRAASRVGESTARWQGSRRGGGWGGVRRASTLPSRWPSLLPVRQPIRRPLGREAWGAP